MTNHLFFAELDDIAFNMLAIAIEMILYAPGDAIFLRGERPHGMYFICSGEVRIAPFLGFLPNWTTLKEHFQCHFVNSAI